MPEMHDDPFGHAHVTVIEPARGWRMLDWRELWAYRELLWVLMSRDVRVRYKQTVLGAGWALLRPVLAMLIFTVVFGKLAHMPSDGVPYPLFVYAGLLPWNFFAASVSSSANSLVGSSHLVSKVYFPRLIIPMSAVGAALVDMLVSTSVLIALMAWYGVGWSAQNLAAPVILLGISIAAFGVGTLLSALTVTYRDFTHITPFLVQVWMYVTPVIFPASIVPEKWRWLLYANPMAGLIDAFRASLIGRSVDWSTVFASLLLSVVALGAGIAYFEKAERRFADVI